MPQCVDPALRQARPSRRDFAARRARRDAAITALRGTVCVVLTSLALGWAHAQPAGELPSDPPAPAVIDPVRMLEVWARVTFAENGQLQTLDLVDEASYPAAFAEQVRRQLRSASIPAPLLEGRPARFQTGVRLRYGITEAQAGGQARLLGLAIRPLPVERSAPPLPLEILRSREWAGRVKGTCTVDLQGQCGHVEIEALPGMPESLRRWARVTMSQWRFEPQRLNDQAVPGEFDHTFSVGVRNARPDDFRTPKFDRIEQQRR